MSNRNTSDDRSREAQSSVAADLLKGAAAGAVATWALDRVDWFMYNQEPEASRRQTWAVRPEHKDTAHVMASKASQALGDEPIPEGHVAGSAVHWALGFGPAALCGAMRDRVPGVGAGRGLAFGFTIFVLEDEVANPAFGFAAPPQRYPWQPYARGLMAHLVYGVVNDLVLSGLNTLLSARKLDSRQSALLTGPVIRLSGHRTCRRRLNRRQLQCPRRPGASGWKRNVKYGGFASSVPPLRGAARGSWSAVTYKNPSGA